MGKILMFDGENFDGQWEKSCLSKGKILMFQRNFFDFQLDFFLFSMGQMLIFNENPDVQIGKKTDFQWAKSIGKILIFNGKNPDIQWENVDFQ